MEFQLAESLNKFHYEILELPCEEFDKWVKYFDWKHEQQKKADKKNNPKQSSRKGYTKTTKTL